MAHNAQETMLTQFCRNFGRHVRRVRFECVVHLGLEVEALRSQPEQRNSVIQYLAQHLVNVLTGHSLPRMTELQVKFLPQDTIHNTLWREEMEFGSGYVSRRDDSAESNSLLDQVFTSLAANGMVKTLEITNLLPCPCPSLYSTRWIHFLSKLHTLRIDLWGCDNEAQWHSNALSGYGGFVRDLNHTFFTRLLSLRRLQFIAHPLNPVGCEGMNHLHFFLKPDVMENIESLELWNCFIDLSLLVFLETKSQQLKSIQLMQCLSASEEIDVGEINVEWSKLFRLLRKASPVLREFTVYNTLVPLTREESIGMMMLRLQPNSIRTTREMSSRGSGRRSLPYVTLDPGTGVVIPNYLRNIERLEQGDDWNEYSALKHLVSSNNLAKLKN